MAGIGGLGSFAGGFAQTFNSALHQQQEIRLRQEQQQAQAQRELMAKADDDRKKLWDTITEQSQAMLAQGKSTDEVSKLMQHPLAMLQRFTKSSGHDPDLIPVQFGMVLSQGSYADVLGGGGQQTAQAAPQRDTAFDQAPQSFTPGMQQGPSPSNAGGVPFMQGQVGGASQPSAGPDMGVAPQPAAPDVQPVLKEQFNRTMRAMRAAKTPEERRVLEKHAEQLLSQSFGKNVKTFQAHDGSGINVYDPATDESHYVPFQKGAGEGSSEEEQSGPNRYGMRDLKPEEMQALKRNNTGPREFDFQAVQLAFGDKSILTGMGRDKAGAEYRKMLRARAADYWLAKGLGPEDALAAQLEFSAMAKGAQTIGNIEGRMTTALEKAEATVPVVIDASKKVSRTDYPLVNELILHWAESTGDTKLPPYLISLETLATNYGSALGMGNSVLSDSMAQHARDLIKKGWSEEQLKAATDQLLNELHREKAAAHSALRTFLRGSRATNSQLDRQEGADQQGNQPAGGEWQTDPETGQRWREVK